MPESDCLHFLPEEGDRSVFKRTVLNALIGDVGQAIRRGLTGAGFVCIHVSKVVDHPVYEISLRRGSAITDETESQLRRRIRHGLKKERLYQNAKTNLLVISLQRERIVCGFHVVEQE